MQDSRNTSSSSDQSQKAAPKPDAETLHTTDPQEHMEGPFSSAMQKTGEAFDTGTSQEDADRERQAGM